MQEGADSHDHWPAVTRVAFVSPEPTPYRAPLLDLVAERPEIELTAVYAHPLSGGWTVSVIGSKGLSRGASNLMTGLALTRRFRA